MFAADWEKWKNGLVEQGYAILSMDDVRIVTVDNYGQGWQWLICRMDFGEDKGVLAGVEQRHIPPMNLETEMRFFEERAMLGMENLCRAKRNLQNKQ